MSDKIARYWDANEGKDGKWYVTLNAANHETIFTSEGYDDKTYAWSVGRDSGLPHKEEM